MVKNYPNFLSVFNRAPQAVAKIKGSKEYSDIEGYVRFYQTRYGAIVISEISGLKSSDEENKSPIFAYHIHEGENCSGNNEDAFADVGMHYNPSDYKHPYHAGDLPPLFVGSDELSFSVVLTNRFNVQEIIGRSIIIHSSVDDFTSQPSGNAGIKIACGEIKKY